MIKYLFQHAILTFIFFMLWISNTSLPGGEVGMAPFLLGIFLAVHLGIGIILCLIFRKYLITVNHKIFGILIYVFIYEFTPIVLGSKPMILGILDEGSHGETSRAFSLIPLFSGVLVLITILLRGQKKNIV